MKNIFFWLIATHLGAGEFRVIDGKDFPKLGMFAAANQILGQLSIYEERQPVEIDGLRVDFGSFGLYYDPVHGLNWWNYYFEPICVGEGELSQFSYPSKKDCFQAFKKRKQLTRVQASEIVKKYIRVREPILNEVDLFASRHFGDFFMIGVHYRGTDKNLEAPRVPYKKVFQAIDDYLPENRAWQIFAATDEYSFLEALQKRFPGKVIACEAHRSESSTGIHLSHMDPYKVGEEALMDALLLSKCNMLIRTSSNLSLWSTYFNPELPTVLLNKKFRSRENLEPE